MAPAAQGFKGGVQLGGALVAVIGEFLQAAHYDGREGGTHLGAELLEGDRGLDRLGHQELLERGPLERPLPGKQLVGQHARRVDVGPVIELAVAGGLLRRHVAGGPQGDSHPGNRHSGGSAGEGLGDPEIGNQRAPSHQKDVVRLDVAMDDPRLMGVGQRVGHVDHDPPHFVDRQRPLPLQPGPQGIAPDERHGVVRPPDSGPVVDQPGGKHRNDVGVLELGGVVDLGPEPLHVEPGHEVRREQFYHDLPTQGGVLGHEDPGHSAPPELPADAVPLTQGLLEVGFEIYGHGEGAPMWLAHRNVEAKPLA